MKEISAENNNNIVNLLEKEIPARQIARQLQIHEKTVRRIRDGACPAARRDKDGRPFNHRATFITKSRSNSSEEVKEASTSRSP